MPLAMDETAAEEVARVAAKSIAWEKALAERPENAVVKEVFETRLAERLANAVDRALNAIGFIHQSPCPTGSSTNCACTAFQRSENSKRLAEERG